MIKHEEKIHISNDKSYVYTHILLHLTSFWSQLLLKEVTLIFVTYEVNILCLYFSSIPFYFMFPDLKQL